MTVFGTEFAEALPGWLVRQRWFAAKGRPVRSAEVVGHTALITDSEPLLDHVLIGVEFVDGSPQQRYQLLVGRRSEIGDDLDTARIGQVGDRVAYDGLWDHDVTAWLLAAVRAGTVVGDLRFVPEPGAVIAAGATGRILGAEQSNTSVVYGEQSILKLFRRVAPGLNPDLELHRALRSVDSAQVAALQGSIEGTLEGFPTSFALVQDFAANSADGWAMALASVRDLLAEADLHADEVGGDFAAEASRLGETVALVHAELARALGTSERDPAELAGVMHDRLSASANAVPALDAYVEAIRGAYDALARLGTPVPAQRVHGDLHLGQTLRNPYGWLVIDFEGEPSASLTDRIRPDSALRDVAAMLRSFDYAAFHQLQQWQPGVAVGTDADSQLAWHAHEWATRNREAFCDGYAAGAGADPRAHAVVLRAFELDKAVYEVLYETRSRPTWAPIPLASIARITAQARADTGAR